MNTNQLGKLDFAPGKLDLSLSDYLPVLPTFPDQVHSGTSISDWTMMDNNVIGDCTCAGAGHAIMCWTNSIGELFIPQESSIVQLYSSVTGYDPITRANDRGAVCTSILDYWRDNGIEGHKILAYVNLDYTNVSLVKSAIYLFELIYIGIRMPLSAQEQLGNWTVTDPSLTGPSTPGSWGGHCVIVVGYDDEGLDLITWGERYRMTWEFFSTYVDEVYVILSQDFINNNEAPNGFDLTQLQSDLTLL
jgi:hypothetical protein